MLFNQFDFLDKGIARAEKSTAKLNKQLSSQIIGLNSTQKTLPKLVSSINNGTITTKGFTQALKNQATSIAPELKHYLTRGHNRPSPRLTQEKQLP